MRLKLFDEPEQKSSIKQALAAQLREVPTKELAAFCKKQSLELRVAARDPYTEKIYGNSCPGVSGNNAHERDCYRRS